MYLFELDNQTDEVNSITVAADRLEDLHKEGKLKNNWSLDQLVTFVNHYLYEINSDLILTDQDILDMFGSEKNPFRKSIQNIQGGEVVFKGNQEKTTQPASAEQSKDVVDKMAKKALKK